MLKARDKKAALDWLCLNVDLESLPPRFCEKGGAHRIVKHAAGSVSSRAGHGPSNEAPQYADGILRPAIIPGSARMGGVEAASGSETVQWSAAENAALVLQMASQQEQDDAAWKDLIEKGASMFAFECVCDCAGHV